MDNKNLRGALAIPAERALNYGGYRVALKSQWLDWPRAQLELAPGHLSSVFQRPILWPAGTF